MRANLHESKHTLTHTHTHTRTHTILPMHTCTLTFISLIQSQVASLQQQVQSLHREKDDLAEANKALKKNLDQSEDHRQECENEITR